MTTAEQVEPDIILYWNSQSQPSRAVKALLEIGQILHKEVVMDLMSG